MHYHLKPPAKINLHLEILNKRSDGYHNLRSLMAKIDLYDQLDVEITTKTGYHLYGFDIERHLDILYKSYLFFKKKSGLNFGLKLKLNKNIPIQAGLGGGSADAGLLLACLNRHFKYPIQSTQLVRASGKVGADVPFFVQSYPTAIIEGIGEIIHPVEAKPYSCLIIKDNFSIATKQAFAQLIQTHHPDIQTKNEIIHQWQNKSPSHWRFKNHFTPHKECPITNRILDLYNRGASFVQISGSGSAIVAFFTDEATLQKAHKELSVVLPFCEVHQILTIMSDKSAP
jgi:4-diphosphocytidyl-2-C-methyl-D-erythritol kinase